MKEVRYWQAEDGMMFKDEDNCIEYEREQRLKKLISIVPCYTSSFMRITGEDEGIDASCVSYILIPDCDNSSEFWGAIKELETDYFRDQLYYGEARKRNDLLYYDEDSDCWRVWSKDLANLELLKNHFQLFSENE